MASSRPEAIEQNEEKASAVTSARAFALQELHACWSQAFEAMARGDLAGVESLLDEADHHVRATTDGTADSVEEARLRNHAFTAHARLQHAMQAGLEGLSEELGRARKGAKALRGYGQPGLRIGQGVTRNA